MEWDHLICRPDALELLKIPGILQLLSGQDDAAQADPGWTEAHLLLRKLAAMGLHRLPDNCDGNTIVLPTTISGEASSACRRPGDTGQALVGGHVRLKYKGVTKAGTMTAYDDTTSQYSIEYQDFSIQTWT